MGRTMMWLWLATHAMACATSENPCTGLTESDCRADEECTPMEAFECVSNDATYGGCMEKAYFQENPCGDMGAVASYDGTCLFYPSTCVPEDAEECPSTTVAYGCY